jgi:hypothetical protein
MTEDLSLCTDFEKIDLSGIFAPTMTIEQLKDMKSRLDGLRGFL